MARGGRSPHGQRVDNYLLKILKGVPKSHIYRILRSGEVRVNSRRVGAYRLQEGDKVRLPPVRTARRAPIRPRTAQPIRRQVLLEDEDLLVARQARRPRGPRRQRVSIGVIEQLRAARPQARVSRAGSPARSRYLGRADAGQEAPRPDRPARAVARGRVQKLYLVLVKGHWRTREAEREAALHKYVLHSGERRVP